MNARTKFHNKASQNSQYISLFLSYGVVEVDTACPQMCVSSTMCVNVWWQIEGAGRLRGPMTPPAPVAAAERERHSQIRPALPPATREKKVARVSQNVTLALFPLSLSVWFSLSPSFVFPQETTCIPQTSPASEALLLCIKLLLCDREKEDQFAASFHTSYLITRGVKKVTAFFFFSWISNHSDNWTQVIHPLLFSSWGISRLRFTQSWKLKSRSWGLTPSTKQKFHRSDV